jgi:hypothetical protein
LKPATRAAPTGLSAAADWPNFKGRDMTRSKQTVDDFLAALPTPVQELASALRQIIRKAAPELTEGIKWGMPCYWGAGNVCAIMALKNHVNLAFFRGAELTDAQALLEGTGKGMRHIKIRYAKDIRKQAFVALVKEAARNDQ